MSNKKRQSAERLAFSLKEPRFVVWKKLYSGPSEKIKAKIIYRIFLTQTNTRITRSYMPEQTEVLVVRIPVSVLKLLREQANVEDRSVAYIVRRALKQAFKVKK